MSKIEWTDETWNPITGCTKISAGCQNCYAERMAKGRLKGRFGYPKDDPFRPGIEHSDQWERPFKWRNPRNIFVCSMGDLFHDDVSFELVDKVLALAALCPQHTFQLLTKRPKRMNAYFSASGRVRSMCEAADIIGNNQMGDPDNPHWMRRYYKIWHKQGLGRLCAWIYEGGAANIMFKRKEPGREYPSWIAWPLPNLWLGVTAENQEQADKRIPILLQIPAAVRFVSVEPMLGPVDLTHLQPDDPPVEINALAGTHGVLRPHGGKNHKLDQVICGGESGPRARPMHPDWARSLRDQCVCAGVPFFFKQWGEWGPGSGFKYDKKTAAVSICGRVIPGNTNRKDFPDDTRGAWTYMRRVGKKAAGRELDGKTWDQRPEVKS
jgi:protein gp37